VNATAMLGRAASDGDAATVRKCLENGANVDAAEASVSVHYCAQAFSNFILWTLRVRGAALRLFS